MRTTTFRKIANPDFKHSLLRWAQQFREVVFLDSNNFPQKYSSFDWALAVDAFTSIKTGADRAFDALEEYRRTTADWIFGYLTYDLKNDVEDLVSENHDGLDFPDLYFFQPKRLFVMREDELQISYLRMCDDEMESDFFEILSTSKDDDAKIVSDFEIKSHIDKTSYLEKVGKMLSHISRGDIYEANFCLEFFAENAVINPLEVYNNLNEISHPPFAAFLKVHKHFAMCASPERYLRKDADKIISQPIKGTAKRDIDPTVDRQLAENLVGSRKERSENIMITDLVRNDLSRTAGKGSVEVEELCGLYTFPQVHHLISTITSKISDDIPTVQVIRDCFPMGSMTGAPKISAMKIIEELEETKRGLYSGSIGYFTPDGDFDFNVVIRSILYNSESKYLSFSTGSAITSLSNPEQEYDECMLKAAAMKRVLTIG